MFTLRRLCLAIAAEEQAWGNSGLMWLWGWKLVHGQKWESPLLVKTTTTKKIPFYGTGCAVGGDVWHEEIVAINTEAVWRGREVLLA